jgi:hypothetical protein
MSLFLDFDKNEKVFYNNLYIDDYNLVVKTPINKKEKHENRIKIELFDLTKYTYLTHYDS